MKIENVRYVVNQKHPELHMEIDGRTAKLHADQKPTLNAAGFVFLGAGWSDLVPELEYNGTPLRGFTKDPEIVRLYRSFRLATASANFQPGVPLPHEG